MIRLICTMDFELVAFTLLYIGQCVVSETAVVGSLYQYTLNKEDFFDKFSPDFSHPVVFQSSLVSKPGLPSWLQYIQGDTSTGYLYGTPNDDSVGVFKIEIIGLNTYSYEPSRVRVDITVRENQVPLWYLSSFFIADKSVEDFLQPDAQKSFLSAVESVWPDVEQIHQLQTGQELGLAKPLPTDINQEEGVAVVVGSSRPFSEKLLQSPELCINASQEIVLEGYSTTWCDITMTELEPAVEPAVNKSTPIYLGGGYNPPAMPMEEPASRMLEFIFIVAVPFGVIMLVILILAYIMYGRREGIKTRDSRTDSLQLTHHIEIRHASRDLRELSTRRDPATPRMSGAAGRRGIPSGPVDSTASSASGTPARHRHPQYGETSGSASSTPSMHPRMIPPPAYRLPPHPGGLQETSFSQDSPGSRRQTPGHTPGQTPRQTPKRPARGVSPKLSSPQRI